MRVTIPQLINTEEGFTDETDTFGFKHYGESLANLFENSDDALVVGIDSAWGTGKTTFADMWVSHINKSTENNLRVIKFDSFANDYQKDAFLAFTRCVYALLASEDSDEQTRQKAEAFRKGAVKTAIVLARSGLKIGTRLATAGLLNESLIDELGALTGVNNEAATLVDNLVSEQMTSLVKDEKVIDDFREELKSITKDNKIVIVVDELDRCSPVFALALIESIKHVFSIEGLQFLLLMNRVQFERVIDKSYGLGNDASIYLDKFVHLWTRIPESIAGDYTHSKKYCQKLLDAMDAPHSLRYQKSAIETMEYLVGYYELTLRQVERALTNYAIFINQTEDGVGPVHLQVAVFFSILKVIMPDVYQKIGNDITSSDTLIENAKMKGMKQDGFNLHNPYDLNIGTHPLHMILFGIMSADDRERHRLTVNVSDTFNGNWSNAIVSVKTAMDVFSY